ncbi:5-formyltetrahydrofolate cyclo-ligase [Streptococcus dentiloxodontae]
MTKSDIRQQVLAQLKAQPSERKKITDLRLLAALTALPCYKKARTLATYLAFSHEYDTQLLIEQARRDGKRIVVPKTYPKGQMIFVDYDENDLMETRFGLLEPMSSQAVDKSKIDLIHVPGLAFNAAGYRIGYGAGYYDRYLTDYKGATVSTIYACQRQDFLPDEYDIAVKEVVQCK